MEAKGLLIKGSIGLAGAGAIGFAGYQAVNLKTETREINNIQKRLEKAGYTPITEASASYAEILKSYVAVIEAKEELKFGTFNGKDDNTNNKKAKDALWENCKRTFAEESDTNFNKAKKWCVEPVAVSSILTNKGVKALDTGADDNKDKQGWDKKIGEYRSKSESEKVFSSLDVGNAGEVTTKHRQNIKTKCSAAGKIKNHEDKYEENLKNFEDWCTDKE